ncbi:RNA polymerase II subunit A C-terminal domain phosphatase SSU72-like [Microplitis demolitor]|uniref:RNA polymerase II subunit A C-terminal domain phosphatase SSU72-like n=1 Tax=Microplitis demolitor TaxID=69319 RepID=UPI00235B5FA3|nr:RNA polymerase II subunit A C-terminal domain phosphatase SSU72-like [Microplitis demolitor]
MPEKNLRFAVICFANMNRSMEAHKRLKKKGFDVKSYGVCDRIRMLCHIEGKANVYSFGMKYSYIYNDLVKKNKDYYKKIGLLDMVRRNMKIKSGPERFQSTKERFDVLITCDERAYHRVKEFMEGKNEDSSSCKQPVYLINVGIKDDIASAASGSYLICELATTIASCENLDDNFDELVAKFETDVYKKPILRTVLFY